MVGHMTLDHGIGVRIPASQPLIIEEEERFVPSKGWAEMIRKVYEIDPLPCLKCDGQMRIISFIEEHKVIDKIINLLKLTFKAERHLIHTLILSWLWQLRIEWNI